MNQKRISIIVYKSDEENFNIIMDKVKNFIKPKGYIIDKIIAKGDNILEAYINASHKTDAYFKVFISHHVIDITNNIIPYILYIQNNCPHIGLMGHFGFTLPLNGDITEGKNYCGKYVYVDSNNVFQAVSIENPLMYQKVHSVDSSFFVTFGECQFDSKAGNLFAVDICCNYRTKGKEIIIPMQNSTWIITDDMPECIKFKKNSDYWQEREYLYHKNKDIISPLVSVLIPTYNSPKYFKEALDSALAQTYSNIEIIVGDDSTNDDTETMMEYYLSKYNNIKYFHHEKPLGGNGDNNINFLLNKAEGKYINLLFHDDIIYPNKITQMMEYYIHDVNDEIGIVTSVRDIINEKGEITGKAAWLAENDTIISGHDAIRKIIYTELNYIGEYSTVLIKKKDLLIDDCYSTGILEKYKDTSMGDLSTWIDILKNNRKLVFIKEALSAFRVHDDQNSYKYDIKINGILDLLCFSTICYYKLNIITVKEYPYIVEVWLNALVYQHQDLINNIDIKKLTEELQAKYGFYLEIYKLAKEKKYQEVFELVKDYVEMNRVDR